MASKERSPELDDLDNYFLHEDLEDDPFASPNGDNSASKKRKSPGDGLGLDEEVSVEKKARIPRIKLDRDRLLSEKGIPALRKRAAKLRLKGKGHEWGDASRLLSFYQEWLDDLFPKAKFLDALDMVEKLGHKQELRSLRVEWINEGRPKSGVVANDGDVLAVETDQHTSKSASKQADRIAPIFEKTGGDHPATTELDDLFAAEDDIYRATPVDVHRTNAADQAGGEPDEDELDALMAEEDASARPTTTTPYQSIFGGSRPKVSAAPARADQEIDEQDDLDALLAEAEADSGSRQKPTAGAKIDTREQRPQAGAASADNDEDDLDALMAEAEAQSAPASLPATKISAGKENNPGFDDEEEAMAEMDGLW